MQNREILIANNRNQSKYRVMTDAETLGQLQEDIRRNENVYKMVGQTWIKNESPIDISGLTFTEGITKTQLLSPETQLPTNVQFKGQTTNNLVMLLTNTNKQIRSGAYPTNRKEFGDYIKKNNLGEAIKAEFGDNWTRISSDKLINFFANTVEKNTSSNKETINEVREELKDLGKVKEEVNTPEKALATAPHANTVKWFYTGIKSMVKENLLSSEDVTALVNLLTELAHRLEEEKPKITVDDMNDMMRSIRY